MDSPWPSSFYLECLDDIADIHPCQESPVSNYYPPPSYCFDPTTVSESSSTTLTFPNSHQQGITSHFQNPYSSSSPSSSKLLSFGNSSNSTISNPSSHREIGTGSFAVKTETEEISQMLSFDSSESITMSSSLIQEQTFKSTRTPEQTRYHVLAERKRRKKLSRQFLSLSALVPGLKKGDKASVIEGAISHMKNLEERLKVLEEDQEEGQTQKPGCVCYHYEEKSTPLKKMEIRVVQQDVLIKINVENPTGFTQEKFTSEMKKLDLGVTKIMFLPFGDNMLAVSAVAKMKAEICKTEEELANSIRLAILKLINVRRRHTK